MGNCLQQPFESCLFLQIFLTTEATVDGIEASQLLLTLPEGSTMGAWRSAETGTSCTAPDMSRCDHPTPPTCV